MSVKVMTWIWDNSRSRNGARLVLLAIADAASDDGANAWPSVATIARKANLSERGVQAAIKELTALGELKIKMNAGRNGTNRYTIVMTTPAESAPPQNLHPEESAGVDTSTEPDTVPQDPPQSLHPANPAPPQNSAGTPAESAPEPSLNHPSSSSKKSSTSTRKRKAADSPPEHPRFAEFWAAYPRREGKGKAREAFATAVEAGIDPQVIIDSAGKYARQCANSKTERGFTAHPTTWLNQERWDDDYGNDPGTQGKQETPHCGVCDLPDRTIELHDGSLVRCPDCHPGTERNRR